jgi:hypothetical protein
MNIDLKNLIKYILEGLAIAVSAFIILRNTKFNIYSFILITITAAAVFAILDNFTPDISSETRRGSGVSLGWNLLNL